MPTLESKGFGSALKSSQWKQLVYVRTLVSEMTDNWRIDKRIIKAYQGYANSKGQPVGNRKKVVHNVWKLKIKNFKDYKKLNVKSNTLGEIGIWKFRFNHKLESQKRVHEIYIIRVHILNENMILPQCVCRLWQAA